MRRVQCVVRLAKKIRRVPTGYYLDWWVSVTGYGRVGVRAGQEYFVLKYICT